MLARDTTVWFVQLGERCGVSAADWARPARPRDRTNVIGKDFGGFPEIVLHLQGEPVVGALAEYETQSLGEVRGYAGAFRQQSVESCARNSETSGQLGGRHGETGENVDAENLPGVKGGWVGAVERFVHGHFCLRCGELPARDARRLAKRKQM